MEIFADVLDTGQFLTLRSLSLPHLVPKREQAEARAAVRRTVEVAMVVQRMAILKG